jgi:hypothetical protein
MVQPADSTEAAKPLFKKGPAGFSAKKKKGRAVLESPRTGKESGSFRFPVAKQGYI